MACSCGILGYDLGIIALHFIWYHWYSTIQNGIGSTVVYLLWGNLSFYDFLLMYPTMLEYWCIFSYASNEFNTGAIGILNCIDLIVTKIYD